MLKKILLNPWLALVTLGLILYVRILDPNFVESVRLRYFDTLIASKAPTENNIYTVNIDEASLTKYGQWPFKRDQYAEIIEELYKRHAGLVVWNIMMPEKDRLGGDAVLGKTLKDHPVILANTIGPDKNTPRQPASVVIGAENLNTLYQVEGIISNIPELESNATGVGLTNTQPEIDGVNRRIPLFASHGEYLYPSLPLETLRVMSGDPSFQVKLTEYGVEKMRVPSFNIISTDSRGRIWIDWQQRNRSVSLTELPADFQNALVIVGTTAAGISNPLPTSMGAVYPQDVQASIIGTLINGVNIQRPDWADGAEILAWLLLGIIAIFLTRWKHGYTGIIGLGILIYYTSTFLYARNSQLVDISYGIIAIGLVYIHAYTVKFITELNQKLQIKKQFGTYLSPDLVAQLQRNPDLLRLGGTRQPLSIMFTDVRGFTAISEHYGEDVEGLTSIMNRYMTAMTRKILENRGTLDKYIGDAQMAFWNAPIEDPNHAVNAVRTALEMMESLDEFNKEIAQEGIPAFGMGLGINTGTVVVGNMGSDQRFDYTCLGDAVNLASRLEGQSKNYGVRIILGPETANLVKDKYSVVELDTIAVKGKKVGVTIYTLAETSGYKHTEWLKEYYRGNWNRARKWLRELYNEDNELKDYYAAMLARIDDGLPANWDGVYHATSK